MSGNSRDNLILGGLKLHANLPKHGKEWKATERVNKDDQHKKESVKEKPIEKDEDKGKVLE